MLYEVITLRAPDAGGRAVRPGDASGHVLGAAVSWAIWITGLPGSGKSRLARRVAAALAALGEPAVVLELDEIRKVLTPAPKYSEAERDLVYRALVFMAVELTEVDVPVIRNNFV